MNKTIAGMVGALMLAGQALAAPVAPLSAGTVMQADQARAEIVQGPAHDGDAVLQQAQYRRYHRYYRRHHRRYYR